jgi:hypothetical protein
MGDSTLDSRACRLTYSTDGRCSPAYPNPACNCTRPSDVHAPTLDPVFAAVGSELEHRARGCLVGLKPFQLRQLYALMMGAHLSGVEDVQVVRNEGGLLLRESSLSLVLQLDGRPRSSKGISPIQVENDWAAFGSRRSKCHGACKQLRAWCARTRSRLFSKLPIHDNRLCVLTRLARFVGFFASMRAGIATSSF